jgi:hypothetical protein
MENNHPEEHREETPRLEPQEQQPAKDTNQTVELNGTAFPSQPMTVRMDDPADIEAPPDWGGLFVGERAQLQLGVVGLSEASIQVAIKDHLVIGREVPDSPDKPDLDLSPYGATRLGVSRRHLMITKEDNILRVIDLGATNGTRLNGVPLRANQPHVLRIGDVLSLGHLFLTVVRWL